MEEKKLIFLKILCIRSRHLATLRRFHPSLDANLYDRVEGERVTASFKPLSLSSSSVVVGFTVCLDFSWASEEGEVERGLPFCGVAR